MASNTNFDMLQLRDLSDSQKVTALLAHVNTMSRKLNDLQISQALQSVAASVTVVNKFFSGSGSGASGLADLMRIGRQTGLGAGPVDVPFTSVLPDLDYEIIYILFDPADGSIIEMKYAQPATLDHFSIVTGGAGATVIFFVFRKM